MPLVELIAVLVGVLLLVSPFISLALLAKYKKLRQSVDQLAEDNSRTHAALEKAVADLKRQFTIHGQATAPPSTPKAATPIPTPVMPMAPAAKEPDVVVPHEMKIEPPAPIKVPAPIFLFDEKKQVPPSFPAKPEFPPAAKIPVETKLPAPETMPPVAQAIPSVPPAQPLPPASAKTTAPTPPKTLTQPGANAARIAGPSAASAFRVPASKPTFQQRMKTVSAIEEALGTNWLFKIGIIIFVLGVAFLGIYELGALGPLGKVGISYLSSAVLLFGGIYLEKNQRYQLLGRTGIGGGWALLFFSAFGMYHVDAMRVLPLGVSGLTLDCALMLVVALAMGLHTLRYRSQFVTGLAFFLGFTTVALSQDTVYSLSAGVFLAIGLVVIVLKMGWFELENFGILSSYLNHLYWLYRILGLHGAQGKNFPQYHASLAILLFYWLTFRVSYIVRGIKTGFEEHVSTLAALLNVLLLLGVMKFQSVQPELAYLALLIVGAAEFALAQLPVTRKRRQAFVVLSVIGAALLLAAVPFHYSGNNVAILWLVGAEAFFAAGIVVKEVVFRRLGLATGLLVGFHLAGVDFRQLAHVRFRSEEPVFTTGVLFSLCAVVFYLNALGAGRRWKELFDEAADQPLLAMHSYIGAFAAASAAWALFSHDWTAVALAVVMVAVAALGRALESGHMQLQYALIGVLTAYRGAVINLHLESPEHTHVRMRLLTLPILAAVFYVTAKLAEIRAEAIQRGLRGLLAAAGSVFAGLLIWFEVPELWQPLALVAFAMALSEAGRAVRYHALAWHAHVIAGLAVFTAMTVEAGGIAPWHTIPVNALSMVPVVAGCYWLAKRLGTEDETHLWFARAAYTWVGSSTMVWVLHEALKAPWIAVGWIVFAVSLVIVTRWIPYAQLAWQANFIGVSAFLRAYLFNYNFSQILWGAVSVRVLSISLVAAGLYFLSRQAAPDERYDRPVAFLHSFAATGLLTLLAWYVEPTGGWLAPLWAAFALVLAIADQWLEFEELPWQSHILAVLTLLRSVSVNLYVTDLWHDVSVRLVSLAIVAVIFYALSRLVRLPEEWRARDFHHVYSWAASSIVGLLLWYELQARPAGIAVAWAAFGLVLFEYGLLRKITQFRYQAYLAMVAAFTRIFFSNLTASEPGEFWGPRLYTILPLAMIFYFVYAQLPMDETDTRRDRRWHFDGILAWLGTVTVVALCYYQFPLEWVVTSWAGLIFVLLGVADFLQRPLFLYQGLLLTILVLARSMVHNLFGASYFSGGDWSGNYLTLSSTSVILLASLFFAFRLRRPPATAMDKNPSGRVLRVIASRPEQVQFFTAILLITCMLALKMRAGMVTVSWGLEGLLLFLFALALKERSFRLTGLGLLLLCIGKLCAMDVWGLQPQDRYITFIIVGAAVSFVSFLYNKYSETIRQYL